MEKIEEQIKHLYREDERKERRLNIHSERLDKLEQFKSSTETEIKNLIEQIKNLVATMKWFMGFSITVLVGFFIWYVQQIGR